MSGPITTDPWSVAVAEANWRSISSAFAPSGTSMWKAKTSTGSRVQAISLPFAADVQPDQLVELAGGRMIAGKPFREEQHHVPGLDAGERFLRREDAAPGVGRVDVQRHRAGKGNVARLRDGVDEGHRLGLRILGRCGQGGGGKQKRGERETTLNKAGRWFRRALHARHTSHRPFLSFGRRRRFSCAVPAMGIFVRQQVARVRRRPSISGNSRDPLRLRSCDDARGRCRRSRRKGPAGIHRCRNAARRTASPPDRPGACARRSAPAWRPVLRACRQRR